MSKFNYKNQGLLLMPVDLWHEAQKGQQLMPANFCIGFKRVNNWYLQIFVFGSKGSTIDAYWSLTWGSKGSTIDACRFWFKRVNNWCLQIIDMRFKRVNNWYLQIFVWGNLMSKINRHQLLTLLNRIQISAGINCWPFWTQYKNLQASIVDPFEPHVKDQQASIVNPFEPHTNICRHQLLTLLNLMSKICRQQLLTLLNLIQISAGINCSPFWNSLYKYLPTSFNGWPFWTSCQSSAGIKTPQI
jgi:hypothetical protein